MFSFRVDQEIHLRQLRESDAKELFALVDVNRDNLKIWLPWVTVNTRLEHTRNFIALSLIQSRDMGAVTAGVFKRHELLGVIGHHNLDAANRNVEIGYWLAMNSRGQGIITRSCRALIDYSFSTLKLHRVEIRCALGNVSSRAVPERLKLQTEGIQRQAQFVDGRFHDLVMYAVLADEWKRVSESS